MCSVRGIRERRAASWHRDRKMTILFLSCHFPRLLKTWLIVFGKLNFPPRFEAWRIELCTQISVSIGLEAEKYPDKGRILFQKNVKSMENGEMKKMEKSERTGRKLGLREEKKGWRQFKSRYARPPLKALGPRSAS